MINAADVFKVFAPHRGNAIVTRAGAAGRHWPDFGTNDRRDLTLGGALGHTVSAAFGVALGLPQERVVLFDSEGALLMNLGILATIADKRPRNFYHILLDNRCYATTGGQPVPNAKNIDFAGLAKAAGYPATYSFDELAPLASQLGTILAQPGPVFVAIRIVPEVENAPIGQRQRRPVRPRAESIRVLQQELGIASK